MGLTNNPLCRRCGAEDTSAHIFVSVKLGDTQTYPSEFLFLGPRGCRKSRSRGNLELYKRNRAPMTWNYVQGAQRACQKCPCTSEPKGLKPIYYSILFCSNCTFILYSDINMCYTSIILDIVHCLLYSK
jgi:hypothetical protein